MLGEAMRIVEGTARSMGVEVTVSHGKRYWNARRRSTASACTRRPKR